MKKSYLLLLFHALCFSVSAQQCLSDYFSTKDLSAHIPGLTIATTYPTSIPYGKASTNFKDVQYAEDCATCTGVCSGYSCGSDLSVLKYYVYYPDLPKATYLSCPRPAVMLFHGGGYSGCGDFDDKGIKNLCQELAYRGFVCFDVNYRVGVLASRRKTAISSPYYETAVQQLLAIYRACQDARGAIRSIIKRQNKEGTLAIDDPYRIDINNIILGGVSAGSLIAMNSAYYSSSMINAVFGTAIQSVDPTNGVLRPIDVDYYYGNSNYNYFPNIKCVFNMWGSMFVPVNQISNISGFFSTAPRLPIISFQGQHDDVFSVTQQNIVYSRTPWNTLPVNSDNRCLIGTNTNNYYTPPLIGRAGPDMKGIGALTIYNTFQSFSSPSVFTEVYVDCEMYHGLDCEGCAQTGSYDRKCRPCTFSSDFGTGLTTPEDVYSYIAGREATFYQALICNVGQTSITVAQTLMSALPPGKSKFINCPNYRVGTNTNDNPTNCNITSCTGN